MEGGWTGSQGYTIPRRQGCKGEIGLQYKSCPSVPLRPPQMRGESPECVISHLLEDNDNDSDEGSHAVDEDVVKNVGAVAVEGGSDTVCNNTSYSAAPQ